MFNKLVDVATYAFSTPAAAFDFAHDCGANYLTASGPRATKSGWTVRVLIPTNPARESADKCAKGAAVVAYAFEALPAPMGGLEYTHF